MNRFINQILHGNSVDVMKNIPNNSIDLTLTSPPYDSLRSYNNKITDKKFDDHFSFPFVEMATELYRITKDGGLVVWIVNDQVIDGGESGNSFRQALKFQEIGFKIYDTMIYHKNGAAYHETGRYDQVFEYMFVLLKGKRPNTVNLIKDKPNKWFNSKTFGTPSSRQKDGSVKKMKEGFTVGEYGTRYNVWYIVNSKGFGGDKLSYNHPASFPESLAEDHILSWSNEGDVILDPMCGSGTSLKMAKLNNRNFIGIDINEEYVNLSKQRIEMVVPYTAENPNPKSKFIVSREEILEKRKQKKVEKN
jgi:site-specific DNA-methyltransferase (adenine-specific)